MIKYHINDMILIIYAQLTSLAEDGCEFQKR